MYRIKKKAQEVKQAVSDGRRSCGEWIDEHGGRIARTGLCMGLCYCVGKLQGMKEQRESELEIDIRREERRHSMYHR